MKELSIEEKARRYDEAIERAKAYQGLKSEMEIIFPELKESEDERIRKALIKYYSFDKDGGSHALDNITPKQIVTWLEKQADTNETINRDGVLRGAAINLITWIDYNAAQGNMCLSNMECKDIEDALVSGDWDKIYAYMKKKLEKQGEQKQDPCHTCDHPTMSCNDFPCERKQGEQKPTEWSEEDEKMISSFLHKLEVCTLLTNKEYMWGYKKLKSLTPQATWKPSDEQIEALKDALNDAILQYDFKGSLIKEEVTRKHAETIESLYNDLKKLREE